MTIAVAKEGETIVAVQYGSIKLFSSFGDKVVPVTLKNVVYIPNAHVNLLSVRKMEEAGLTVQFSDGKVLVKYGSQTIACGSRRGKLYELTLLKIKDVADSCLYSCGKVPKCLEIWHRRFGHISAKGLDQILRNEMVIGMQPIRQRGDEDFICEACVAGKLTRKQFVTSEDRRSSRLLELIHSDICGPITPVGFYGEKYFITYIFRGRRLPNN